MQGSLRIMGLMSGSSLDGLDVAVVDFMPSVDGGISFEVCAAQTLAYDKLMEQALATAHELGLESWLDLHVKYAQWMAAALGSIHKTYKPQALALHGHTIFHNPKAGYTVALGHGGVLAALLETRVVCDFRSMDVALGGQGAPLVPFAERMLYPNHRAFLNLGGIANLSIHGVQKVLAYDVVPCNQLLNHLAQQLGKSYDDGGMLARSGKLLPDLLHQLNAWPFLAQQPPKSMGREDVQAYFLPLLDAHPGSVADKLHTVVSFIATHLAQALSGEEVLITGGGALNTWLLEELKRMGPTTQWRIPDGHTIHYKEAISFALLGRQVLLGLPNILASATGSCRASISGALYDGRTS